MRFVNDNVDKVVAWGDSYQTLMAYRGFRNTGAVIVDDDEYITTASFETMDDMREIVEFWGDSIKRTEEAVTEINEFGEPFLHPVTSILVSYTVWDTEQSDIGVAVLARMNRKHSKALHYRIQKREEGEFTIAACDIADQKVVLVESPWFNFLHDF